MAAAFPRDEVTNRGGQPSAIQAIAKAKVEPRAMASLKLGSWIMLILWIVTESMLCAYQTLSEPTYAFDWDAYMEQSSIFTSGVYANQTADASARFSIGTWNYSELIGDTGPIAYPAGHLWLYSAILRGIQWDVQKWTTESTPKNKSGYELRAQRPDDVIRSVQTGHAMLWLATCVAFGITCQMVGLLASPWTAASTLLLASITRRTRSIYVLGLFNDAFCMTVVHVSVALIVWLYSRTPSPPPSSSSSRQRLLWWSASSALYSTAVSIKMNALLVAPGLLVLYLKIGGVRFAALQIGICVAVQLCLAAPFLLHDPWAYVSTAFNLGRRFNQEWSVNWMWLPTQVFDSQVFAIALLLCHGCVLEMCAWWYWRHCHKEQKPTESAAPVHTHPRESTSGPGTQPRQIPVDAALPNNETGAASAGSYRAGLRRRLPATSAGAVPAALPGNRGEDRLATRYLELSPREGGSSASISPSAGQSTAADAATASDTPRKHDVDAEVNAAAKSTQRSRACFAATLLWTSNLIGVVFARSLHYQFLSWYWHSLPLLLSIDVGQLHHRTSGVIDRGARGFSVPPWLRLALLILLEVAWNRHPPDALSSLLLTCVHAVLLVVSLMKLRAISAVVHDDSVAESTAAANRTKR